MPVAPEEVIPAAEVIPNVTPANIVNVPELPLLIIAGLTDVPICRVGRLEPLPTVKFIAPERVPPEVYVFVPVPLKMTAPVPPDTEIVPLV